MDRSDTSLRTVWTKVAGLTMHARVAVPPHTATTPPVVLVHGVGVSGRYLLPTAEVLARDYPVYVPDLPGFGSSDKPPRILNVPGLADALAAWVRQAGPARATYVANSLGCQTVLDLAVRHADLVERAVLVGPTTDPQARGLLQQVGRGLLDMLREPLRYWPLLVSDYLRAGMVRTVLTLRHGVRDPVVEKLPRVRVPVLVVRGARDPIAPQRWAEELAGRLPRGRLAVIPEAAHVANYTAPEELARLIREFMTEEPAAGGQTLAVLAGSADGAGA